MDQTEAQQAEELRRFSYWVRHHADRRGLSINAVIRRADLSASGVYAALDGRSNPTLRTLVALAAVLGVELRELLQPIPDDGPLDDPGGAAR